MSGVFALGPELFQHSVLAPEFLALTKNIGWRLLFIKIGKADEAIYRKCCLFDRHKSLGM